jgi:hypothetical protein
VRLDDKKIHNFGARRTNVTGLGAREPRAEELALPKSVESGNFTLAKAIIRVDERVTPPGYEPSGFLPRSSLGRRRGVFR